MSIRGHPFYHPKVITAAPGYGAGGVSRDRDREHLALSCPSSAANAGWKRRYIKGRRDVHGKTPRYLLT